MNTPEAIQRLRQVIRRQHKADSTEATYVYWLRKYIARIQKMDEALSSKQKLESFLTELACEHSVSASTQNQAFNAIVYFYQEVLGQTVEGVKALRARRPVHMRHAPSVSDTHLLLQTVRDEGDHPTKLIVHLLYGCGLRVSEPLNLRIPVSVVGAARFAEREGK
jgi:site-specific recombinase XerD